MGLNGAAIWRARQVAGKYGCSGGPLPVCWRRPRLRLAFPPGRSGLANTPLSECTDVELPEKTRPRLYLVDGYALIYRAFFALISRPLISSRGENTSASWGVTKFLIRLLEQHQPDYLGVVFDAGMSERHVIYP